MQKKKNSKEKIYNPTYDIVHNPSYGKLALVDVATFCYGGRDSPTPMDFIIVDFSRLHSFLTNLGYKPIYFLDSPRISRAKMKTNKVRKSVMVI